MTLELKFILSAHELWKCSLFDYSFPWLTYIGSHLAVILFIILTLIFTKNKRTVFSIFIIYFIQSIFVYGLKYLIQRERPLYLLSSLSKINIHKGEILDPSFPSAHATYAFMMATILSYRFPRYRLLFFMIAGFIAWTRVYLHLHYPTDVIIGALFGYIITKILLKNYVKKFEIVL